jgi:hypothetical protein
MGQNESLEKIASISLAERDVFTALSVELSTLNLPPSLPIENVSTRKISLNLLRSEHS